MRVSHHLPVIIAVALGAFAAWLAGRFSSWIYYQDALPVGCAIAVAVLFRRKLKEPDQGIILSAIAGVAISLFTNLVAVTIDLVGIFPVLVRVLVPGVFSVTLFLLLCQFIFLRQGWKPLLLGGAIQLLVRLTAWFIFQWSDGDAVISDVLVNVGWPAAILFPLLVFVEKDLNEVGNNFFRW